MTFEVKVSMRVEFFDQIAEINDALHQTRTSGCNIIPFYKSVFVTGSRSEPYFKPSSPFYSPNLDTMLEYTFSARPKMIGLCEYYEHARGEIVEWFRLVFDKVDDTHIAKSSLRFCRYEDNDGSRCEIDCVMGPW